MCNKAVAVIKGSERLKYLRITIEMGKYLFNLKINIIGILSFLFFN